MASWQLLTYLLLTYSTGFSTEDTVFVMTGASVQLNIQRDKLPDQFDEIVWQNDKSENVVKYYKEFKAVKYYNDYKDRVEFNTESFSLTLKNMKKTDSGVYTAIATGASITFIAEHRVSVIGFSTEDTVFVETGASVQLNIQRDKLPDEFDEIVWKKDKLENVVKYSYESKRVKPYGSYINRVDFNIESFSLTLKNMKKTDSGVYTATANGAKDTLIAEHRVSVIDAVEAPVLTVNSNSSTGLCNFTCTADNITINSVINNSISCLEEKTSSGVYNLNLRCIDDSIICNHSNPVSSKNDTKTIDPICTVNPEKDCY